MGARLFLLLLVPGVWGCHEYWSRERPARDGAPPVDQKTAKKDQGSKDQKLIRVDQGKPDLRPDRALPDKQIKPDAPCPAGCNKSTHCVEGKCVCFKGLHNKDGNWNNGCEYADPVCNGILCNQCPNPTTWCGQNAECRLVNTTHRCRCINGGWINKNVDWVDGCEAKSAGCSEATCNNCYEGYCGPFADCKTNKCTCVVAGRDSCDGKWEKSGCECKGKCVAGKCVP